LDTQSRIAYAEREARKVARDESHMEILKLIEAGFTTEQIKERLKADNK
jgi:hypothetical protein